MTDGVSVSLATLVALRGEARHLDIAPRSQVLASRSGGHLSRFRGRGMEFDESRAYQPGDDVRNMDWRVTARAGKPHVKLYREERERPVWLLVDLGPSMRFGTRTAFKSVVAARAAALLGWAATDDGDRVGGLVYDETRQFEQRPNPRGAGLLPLLKALSQRPLPSAKNGYGALSDAATHLARLVRPGSLVFLLSDFLELSSAATAWLAALSASNEVVLVQIYDPLEAAAPPPARYPVTDGAASHAFLDTRSSAARQAYAQRFATHRARLADLVQRHRVHRVEICTNRPVGSALMQGLGPRRRRRGRSP
jgi:uncharacterized protein (DUF58 family)